MDTSFKEILLFADVSNAFESQNLLYRAVTGKEEDLFSVYEDDFRVRIYITTEDDLLPLTRL